MSSSQRFQRKLWELANSCKSGSVQWNKSGDVVVFDFTSFKKEFLDHSDKFCKSSKIASFVRQLNLYGFRKVSNSRRLRKRDIHEFKHPWFARSREDWLQYVTRNSTFSNICKKGPKRRRKRSMQKKSRQKIQVSNAAPKAVRRGRPQKSEHISQKFDENDHSYEKKCRNVDLGSKELEAWSISSLRVTPSPRKLKKENLFNSRPFDPYFQSKTVELQDITNTFSNTNSAVEAKAAERRSTDCESICNKVVSWQNGNGVFSKCHASLNQEQRALSICGFQNQENIPPMPKALAAQPSTQWDWNGTKPELHTQLHGDGTFPPKVFYTNKMLIEHLPYAPAHSKTTWAMKATLDENQHVMLKIDDSYANPTATLDKGNNYKTKLIIQNGHISKQLLSAGRVEAIQPYARNILSTNGVNIAASNNTANPRVNKNYTVAQETELYEPYSSYESTSKQLLPRGTLQPHARNILSTNAVNIAASNTAERSKVDQNYNVAQETKVYEPYSSQESISKQLLLTGRVETLQPCVRNISTNAATSNSIEHPTVNQNYHVVQDSREYEPYFSYETDCYVTQEFLDIREAYFKHYPERRSFDGPDLRIYR